MSANYPANCWYVAGLSTEVADSPTARRILGQDVVLWRGNSGMAYAFENRCAHRAFPLSHSIIDGEQLVCGYHGCTYGADGVCVSSPSQDPVPSGMRVRVFPVVDEPPFLWIWPGSPGSAALSRPPTVPWVHGAGWETFYDAWTVGANYMMVHEHYLDFSYAPILHAADIPESIRSMPAFSEVEVTETTVSYTRVLPLAHPTNWEAEASGLDRDVQYRRRETGTFASPGLHLQRWDVDTAPAGVLSTTRIHAITPETPTSTHVIMAASRNYAPADPAVTARLRSFLCDVSRRDRAVLDMAAQHSGYERWKSGTEFQADVASGHARRIVGVLLSNERAAKVSPC